MMYALPLLCVLLLAELAGGVLRSPYLSWNAIRLARSLELLRGWPLYPGRDAAGAIIGTLHTPLSHFFYMPAAMLVDPTAALVAGSSMAVLAVFVPLAWVMVGGARPVAPAMLCFLFVAFLIIQSPGAYNVLFMIHADAPAVGMATLACGVMLRARASKRSYYWLAGFACALSIATKQTMAPVVVALAAYLLLVAGVRATLHFLGAATFGGIFLLAVILTVWPAPDVFFNIWTLAAARPMKPAALRILSVVYRTSRLDALPALVPILFIAAYTWRRGLRQFARMNGWLVFVFCAVCIIPISLKAMVTIGSDINHLGVVLYFLFAGAGLAIQQHLMDADHPPLQLGARIFLAIGILTSLAPGLALRVGSGWANLRDNPTQVAADFSHRHPGRAYFPWNPAAAIREEGRLYHLDPALFDREAVGYAVTPGQLHSGLPKQFTVVALPPGEQITSQALQGMTANYRAVTDPELPGWTLLELR